MARVSIRGLYNWTLELLSSPDKVVGDTENNKTASNDNIVVHHVDSWVQHRGPEAEEANDHQVDNAESVVGNAKSTREMERTPDKLGTSGVGQGWEISRAWKSEAFGGATIEKNSGDEIGGVEAGDG